MLPDAVISYFHGNIPRALIFIVILYKQGLHLNIFKGVYAGDEEGAQ